MHNAFFTSDQVVKFLYQDLIPHHTISYTTH